MMFRVGRLSVQDTDSALDMANSMTTAFPTADAFYYALPRDLYYHIPVYPNVIAGSLDAFKQLIHDVAMEGENVEGRISVPTQVAVLSTLALFATQAQLLERELAAWRIRHEEELSYVRERELQLHGDVNEEDDVMDEDDVTPRSRLVTNPLAQDIARLIDHARADEENNQFIQDAGYWMARATPALEELRDRRISEANAQRYNDTNPLVSDRVAREANDRMVNEANERHRVLFNSDYGCPLDCPHPDHGVNGDSLDPESDGDFFRLIGGETSGGDNNQGSIAVGWVTRGLSEAEERRFLEALSREPEWIEDRDRPGSNDRVFSQGGPTQWTEEERSLGLEDPDWIRRRDEDGHDAV